MRPILGSTSVSPTHKPRDEVYAILRSDDFHDPATAPEVKITVKAIVWSQAQAEAEVKRLNALNAAKGCHYWSQLTRLFPRDSAGAS